MECAFIYIPKKVTHCGMGWLLENGRKRQELTGKKDKKKGVNWGKGKKQNENWEVWQREGTRRKEVGLNRKWERELKLGNSRKKMGNERMWSIEENKMKKMGITRKVDGRWKKMWIYRVLIISYRSSNYRSCRHTIWF